MADALPNGKCLDLPNSVIYCNVTSVHISRGKFPYGTCIIAYVIIGTQFVYNNFMRISFAGLTLLYKMALAAL